MALIFVPIVESRFRTKLPPALIVMQSCKQDNLKVQPQTAQQPFQQNTNATQQSVYVNVPGKQSNGIGTTGTGIRHSWNLSWVDTYSWVDYLVPRCAF